MILFYQDGVGDLSVLLEKRSDDHTWAIPGGEYSSDDRSLLDTAVRETLEETGITVNTAEHVVTYRLPFFKYAVFSSALNGAVSFRKNWETDEIRWFSIAALPADMNWMTKIEIRDFMKRRM